MINRSVIILSIIILIFLTNTFSCVSDEKHSDEKQPIIIATTASMRPQIDSLIQVYNAQYKQEVQVVSGSSGKLFAQIKNGAPYDMFISADSIYSQKLYRENKQFLKPVVFAKGHLILLIRANRSQNLKRTDSILIKHFNQINKLGLASPNIAPFGQAAKEALDNLGLWHTYKNKIVYGGNIQQVNQLFQAGTIDFVLTSSTSIWAMRDILNSNGILFNEIPQELYTPINYTVMSLSQRKGVDDFQSFLLSKEGKRILESFELDGFKNVK